MCTLSVMHSATGLSDKALSLHVCTEHTYMVQLNRETTICLTRVPLGWASRPECVLKEAFVNEISFIKKRLNLSNN